MPAGGDGDSNVDADLAKSRDRIITHLNNDHGDSLLAYASHYAKLTGATAARLTDLSSKGFTLDVTVSGQVRTGVFIAYPRPLLDAKEIRAISVEMHHEAYTSLGLLYRLRHGYYKSKALMQVEKLGLIKHHGGLTRSGQLAVGAATVGAVAVAAMLVQRARSK